LKHYLWILFLAIVAPKVYAITPTIVLIPKTPPTPQISQIPVGVWTGYSLLKHIASCESTGSPDSAPRQFLPDGTILWGNDPTTGKPLKRDEGILQINTYVWQKLATSMGDDLNTEQGNIAFGKYLFDKYGSAPWTPSKNCWGKYQTI